MIKIRYIKFYNHKIFNSQIIDFSFDDGTIPNNIIIAGKNGTGKTKLLEEIDNSMKGNFFLTSSNIYNINTELELELVDEDYYDINTDYKIDKIKLYICVKNQEEYRTYAETFVNNEKKINIKKGINGERIDYINFNSVYSSVDINYKPRDLIRSVTDKKLDEEYISPPLDIAEEIIQLIVDISNQDNNDLAKWVRNNLNKKIPFNMLDKRMTRFTNAFRFMFDDNIIFDGVRDNIIPIFKKNNKEIEINELSSGEKQIIFRGTYLLRNRNSLFGYPVIIDEPEISMHPIWEEKIFDYYNSLFRDNDNQTSQIFIATHSEHVLSKVLDRDDSIVIKLEQDSYKKYSKKSNGIILPTISIAEIKYLIFDIHTIDFHNLLFGYIQDNLVKPKEEANVMETDKWLLTKKVSKKKYYYEKHDRTYNSLQAFIRNCIDHPSTNYKYNDDELIKSIQEMLSIIIKSI